MRPLLILILTAVSLFNTPVLAASTVHGGCALAQMPMQAAHDVSMADSTDDCQSMPNCDLAWAHCHIGTGSALIATSGLPTLNPVARQTFTRAKDALSQGYYSVLKPPPIFA
jgi:hypothetical protein|tara:strand:- start:259 stop:594 length:336 start_codon:yes stop_codon:yes gene_type:complete